MSEFLLSEIESYIEKAKHATKNAIWSIERAYLPPCQGAPAAFILLSCLIDFLGTLYAGKTSNEETFRGFIRDFMTQKYNGLGYDDKELLVSLRHKLVHNYSIGQGKYVLTHGHSDQHLTLSKNKAMILNLENFFEDVKEASDKYFELVEQEHETELRYKLSKRISKDRTIEDVEI